MRKLLLAMLVGVFLTPIHAMAITNRIVSSNDGDMENCTAGAPADITGSVTCGGATGNRLHRANVMTFLLKYTRGAGDGFRCDIEVWDDLLAEWLVDTTQLITSGEIKVSPAFIFREGATTSENISYSKNTISDAVRLVCSGGGAGDTLQVQLVRSFSPDN